MDAITDWLKDLLVSGILNNLSGMFDSVNEKVADITTQVGLTPRAWNGSIFNMVKNLSDTVILPVAGIICQRRIKIVRKRRRNFVVFRRGEW